MKITTLIFDLGNVVLTNDWHYDCPEKFQEFSDYFGITYSDMERAWNTAWPDFLLGRLTEDEFWRVFLESAESKLVDTTHAKQLYRKYQQENENMFALLLRLKKKYRLAALTTISKEWLSWKREYFDLDTYFDTYVSSGNSGLMKPDPAIYSFALTKLDVLAEECIFVDDVLENVIAAKNKGMNSILFTSQAELEKRLTLLGIL